MNEKTMTKQEVAASLGVTPRTVEAYVKRGRLPSPVRIGKPLVAKARSLGVRL